MPRAGKPGDLSNAPLMNSNEKICLSFKVNNREVTVRVNPNASLLDVLREELKLTGTKSGCRTGECGACTVILYGKPVNSCMVFAVQVEGRHVTTIEGLSQGDEIHPIQQAFIDEGAVQCGFCIPGMIMSTRALLDENPSPRRDEIREALSGNLCRCTGYQKIFSAVETAAKTMKTSSQSR